MNERTLRLAIKRELHRQRRALERSLANVASFLERQPMPRLLGGRAVSSPSRAESYVDLESIVYRDHLGKEQAETRPIAVILQLGPIRGPLPRDQRVRIVSAGLPRAVRRHPERFGIDLTEDHEAAATRHLEAATRTALRAMPR